jgi:hypothetical protein
MGRAEPYLPPEGEFSQPNLLPVHHPSVVLPSMLHRIHLFFPNSTLDIGSGLFPQSLLLLPSAVCFSAATEQGERFCQAIINLPLPQLIVCSRN